MTREERIEQINQQAAERYGVGGLFAGFVLGAMWADEHPNLSSLWHKAKEKPTEEYCGILCENSEGELFDASLSKINATYQSDWEAFIKEWDVVRWAYLWDILP